MVNTTHPVVLADAPMVNKAIGTKFSHIPQWYDIRTCKEGRPKLVLPALGLYTFPVFMQSKKMSYLLAEQQKGLGTSQIFYILGQK